MKKNAANKTKHYYSVFMAAQLGLLIAVPVIIFIIIGIWLDKTMHTSPLFVMLGVIIGFSGGIYNAYRIIKPFI